MYIKNIASYQFNESDSSSYRQKLKNESGKLFRRTDKFIQLALLGACNINRQTNIDQSTAVYLCSGQGNMSSFNELTQQCIDIEKSPSPINFLNSLTSTLSFYINQTINVSGKNIFTFQHKFVVESLLSLAFLDIKLEKENQILLGGVDEIIKPIALGKKLIGLNKKKELGEGSNWLLLSSNPNKSLARIAIISPELTLKDLYLFLDEQAQYYPDYCLIFSDQFKASSQQNISRHVNFKKLNVPITSKYYYETNLLYKIINFVSCPYHGQSAFFINYFEKKYKVTVVTKTSA